MSQLHEALKALAPLAWDDVPQDDLETFLGDSLIAGELICNTIPPPPEGTPFAESKPHFHKPNSAKSYKDMHPSAVRSQPPDEEHEALQKTWGKPVKVNKKDNPLEVAIYKTAGNDRHGAWFARRSVHEGLGFDKFRRAMLREFAESMAVEGGPGAGAVRGIAADRQVEFNEVKDKGSIAVYDLSAQFPGPTTPRQFVTLLMCSEDALSSKSAASLADGESHVPRHLMVISRPVTHSDIPEHSGVVRGQYESVELIREIPLKRSPKSKSTPNLGTSSHSEGKHRSRGHSEGSIEPHGEDAKESGGPAGDDDAELNPVEWIMASRSDPGGGIPRFLVDRGTPEALLSDLHKFLTWACSQDHIPLPDEEPPQKRSEKGPAPSHSRGEHGIDNADPLDKSGGAAPKRASTAPAEVQAQGGIISNLTGAIEAGIDAYAPIAVSNLVHKHLHPHEDDDFLDESDTSSMDSFMSAEDMGRITTAPEIQNSNPSQSTANLSLNSVEGSLKHKKTLSSHEKEILKIAQKRDKLEHDLERKRQSEEDKLRQSQEKDESEAAKQREKIEKELHKAEEKHKKQMEKLQEKRDKEIQKAEERRRKKDDLNKLSLITRERDEFRSQAALWKREAEALRKQVTELQERNETLVTSLGGGVTPPAGTEGVGDSVIVDGKVSSARDSRISLAASSLEKTAD